MRRTAILGLTVALVAGGGAMATSPAFADAGGACAGSHNNFCTYENNDFNQGNTDHWRNFKVNNANFNNVLWLDANGSATSDHMDNETSAIKDRTGPNCSTTLWQNVDFSGANNTWTFQQDDGFLANNNIGDNRASAISFVGSGCA